jgi:hypothetical protein
MSWSRSTAPPRLRPLGTTHSSEDVPARVVIRRVDSLTWIWGRPAVAGTARIWLSWSGSPCRRLEPPSVHLQQIA